MKTLKFRPESIPTILARDKTTTWRMFDDKELKDGDMVELLNADTKEKFADAQILEVKEKLVKNLEDADFDAAHNYGGIAGTIEHFKQYHGDKVDTDSAIKMITFKLV